MCINILLALDCNSWFCVILFPYCFTLQCFAYVSFCRCSSAHYVTESTKTNTFYSVAGLEILSWNSVHMGGLTGFGNFVFVPQCATNATFTKPSHGTPLWLLMINNGWCSTLVMLTVSLMFCIRTYERHWRRHQSDVYFAFIRSLTIFFTARLFSSLGFHFGHFGVLQIRQVVLGLKVTVWNR